MLNSRHSYHVKQSSPLLSCTSIATPVMHTDAPRHHPAYAPNAIIHSGCECRQQTLSDLCDALRTSVVNTALLAAPSVLVWSSVPLSTAGCLTYPYEHTHTHHVNKSTFMGTFLSANSQSNARMHSACNATYNTVLHEALQSTLTQTNLTGMLSDLLLFASAVLQTPLHP